MNDETLLQIHLLRMLNGKTDENEDKRTLKAVDCVLNQQGNKDRIIALCSARDRQISDAKAKKNVK